MTGVRTHRDREKCCDYRRCLDISQICHSKHPKKQDIAGFSICRCRADAVICRLNIECSSLRVSYGREKRGRASERIAHFRHPILHLQPMLLPLFFVVTTKMCHISLI